MSFEVEIHDAVVIDNVLVGSLAVEGAVLVVVKSAVVDDFGVVVVENGGS